MNLMSKFKLKMFKPLEKDIQKSILDYLKAKKVYCWKEGSTGLMVGNGPDQRYMPIGLRGKSDILGCYKGRFLAIEVKRPGSFPTPEQQHFIDSINLNGGLAFVAYSIDDVIKYIK